MTRPRPGRNPEDLRVRPFVGPPSSTPPPSPAPASPPASSGAQPPPPPSLLPPPPSRPSAPAGLVPPSPPARPPAPEPMLGDAGVRPYLLTGGRTRSGHIVGGFETLVVVTELGRERAASATPEQRAMMAAAASAVSIAELSARFRLPLGVAQVLAGDLVGAGYLSQYATPDDAATDPVLLRRLIKAVEGI